MKVLPESGQHGVVSNSSHAIGSLHASFAGGDSGQILHVEHVSLVLLEHQPVFLPEKVAGPSKPIPTILQPEDVCLIHLTSLNICSQHLLSLKAQCPKSIRQECHLPPNDRKLTIPPLP